MTMSVQITFRDIDHSDAVDDRIREHAERLGKKFGERATSLHVTLSKAMVMVPIILTKMSILRSAMRSKVWNGAHGIILTN